MSFPHEAVPDGAVFAPHHAYIGVLLALLAVALVWDDARHAEPWLGAASLLAVTFAFALVWPFYHATGAGLALLFMGSALVSVWSPFWWAEPWLGPRGVLLVGVLVAADDVVSHAFGVPTPLDLVWSVVIRPVIPV